MEETGPESAEQQVAPARPSYEILDLREGEEVADFDFEVSFDDESADRVADRLGAVPGVVEVHVEDRDVLLISAPNWDENRLSRWLEADLDRPDV